MAANCHALSRMVEIITDIAYNLPITENRIKKMVRKSRTQLALPSIGIGITCPNTRYDIERIGVAKVFARRRNSMM